MINILLPSMGGSLFFKENYFPKPLIEINGETMLEHVVHDYDSLAAKKLIFVFGEQECQRFHLDDSAKLLIGDEGGIITLKNQTAGALCTCLMAVDYIDNDSPLIIANADQMIDVDYQDVIQVFEKENCSAGVITFSSVHPRWSYAKLEDDIVVEVAEKRPLSSNAIAGFYYFRKGSDFVRAAKRVLLKNNQLDGVFYISSSLNEIILENKKVGHYVIEKEQYHSFYSPEKIREYEGGMRE